MGVSVSTATPESSLIVTLYPLLQRFNVPSRTVVVASVSCQTCVAMHGSIQMPWSIRRPKENVPTRPVLRAPIPTPPVKICLLHVAQDGEPVSRAGAYPVVAAPALSLDQALRMIWKWKWPKRGSHLLHSHLPTPVDPHISRSHTFPLLVRLLFPMWDLPTRPSLESDHPCDRTLVGYATQPRHSVAITRVFSATNCSRATRSDGCMLVRSLSLAHSYSFVGPGNMCIIDHLARHR